MLARLALSATIFSTAAFAMSSPCALSLGDVLDVRLRQRDLLPANGLPLRGPVVEVPANAVVAARGFAREAAGRHGSDRGLRFSPDTEWQVASAGSTEPYVFGYGEGPAAFAQLVFESLAAVSQRAFDRYGRTPANVVTESVHAADGTEGTGRVDKNTGELLLASFPDPSDPEVSHWVFPKPSDLLVRGPDFRLVDSGIVLTVRRGNPVAPSGEVLRVAPLHDHFIAAAQPSVARNRWRGMSSASRAALTGVFRDHRDTLQRDLVRLQEPASNTPPRLPWGAAAAGVAFYGSFVLGARAAGAETLSAMLAGTIPVFVHALLAAGPPGHVFPFPWATIFRYFDERSLWRNRRELYQQSAPERAQLLQRIAEAERSLAQHQRHEEERRRTVEADFALSAGSADMRFVSYRPTEPDLRALWTTLEAAWTETEHDLFAFAFRRAERLYLTAANKGRFLELVRRLGHDTASLASRRQELDAFLRPLEAAQLPSATTPQAFRR